MSRIVNIKKQNKQLQLMVQTKSKNIKRIKIGYTTGVFDLFHIGHLNILKN